MMLLTRDIIDHDERELHVDEFHILTARGLCISVRSLSIRGAIRRQSRRVADDSCRIHSRAQEHVYGECKGIKAYLNLFVKVPVSVVVKNRSGALMRSARH